MNRAGCTPRIIQGSIQAHFVHLLQAREWCLVHPTNRATATPLGWAAMDVKIEF